MCKDPPGDRHRNGRRHRPAAAPLSRRASARSPCDRPAAVAARRSGGRHVHWIIAGCLIVIGLALAAAGIRNFSRAATPVPTNQPTRALVRPASTAGPATRSISACFSSTAASASPREARGRSILTLPLADHDPLRRRRARGGVPGTAVRRRLPGLQGPRAPLAVAVGQERRPCRAGPAHIRRPR